MYKDKQLASELNEVIHGACQLFDKGRDLLSYGRKSGKCTGADYTFYMNRIALIMGRELLEILSELYWEHPHLIPEGSKPWPRVKPKTLMGYDERQLSLHRSETLVMLRVLWDVFRESKDLNIRDTAERLRLLLPPEEGKQKKVSKKTKPAIEAAKYYRDVITLLEAHIQEIQASKAE